MLDIYKCDDCQEHFAVEKNKYDEPACQCGSTNAEFVGIGGLYAKNGDYVSPKTDQYAPFD